MLPILTRFARSSSLSPSTFGAPATQANFAYKAMYEIASKIALMLRVVNNLLKNGLPYVCIAFIERSLKPFR